MNDVVQMVTGLEPLTYDIFLSYAREDLPRVRPLVWALERQGWSVWWDRTIPPRKAFTQVIEEALDAARCVIVVWSKVSVVSHWVNAEADEGRQRDILIPVMIDEVQIPLGFRQIHTARLLDWQDPEPHEEFDRVLRAVADLLGSPLSRESTESVGDTHTESVGDTHTEPVGDTHITNSIGMEFC